MVPRCPLEQSAPGGSLPLATVLTIFQMTVVGQCGRCREGGMGELAGNTYLLCECAETGVHYGARAVLS